MPASTFTERARASAGVGLRRRGEAGFTLIEVVVAMAVLLIALLGLVATMAHGLSMSKRLRDMSESKMTITSMLEQVETLRNTKRLTFGQIANTGQVDNIGASQTFAGFPTGFRPVSTAPGQDGIFGTADDLVTGPGPDGIYGTSDDLSSNALALPQYEREIVISSLGTNIKKIQVTMHYPGSDGKQLSLVGISYLNNDANSNFR
jgi:prepilin-type N-terminal cleavage/methylation domain-containing protein